MIRDGWESKVERAQRRAREMAVDDPSTWETKARNELIGETLADEHDAFLQWVRHETTWALVVAECAGKVCAKPREAAAFILMEGLRDRLADEGLIEDDD